MRRRGGAGKALKLSNSYALFNRALRVLPGGTSSNARLWTTAQFCPIYTPCTIFIKKARGAHVWDVDNNEYIDYRLGFGPVILGHSDPDIIAALGKAERNGSVYGLDNRLEIEVAERIISMVPCAEMVRFSVTGTEATMHAIRLARAYTRKDVVVKFAGHYHGSHDYLLYSAHHTPFGMMERPYPMSEGMPRVIDRLVLVLQWNDPEAIIRAFRLYHRRIAAVITEPIMGNACAIMPQPGYLKLLRELCDQYDALLIFDEVKTGFRVAAGGAQQLFGIKPHIATYAKSISNGYPLSAIAGQREIMELYGPGKVAQGGTYAGNPVSLTAARATLLKLRQMSVYRRMNRHGKRLMKGIGEALERSGINAAVNGVPTMFQYVPFAGERVQVRNYEELRHANLKLFSRMQYELMRRGVLLDEDYEECIYTCLAHSDEDLRRTLEAFEEAALAAKSGARLMPASRFSVKEAA